MMYPFNNPFYITNHNVNPWHIFKRIFGIENFIMLMRISFSIKVMVRCVAVGTHVTAIGNVFVDKIFNALFFYRRERFHLQKSRFDFPFIFTGTNSNENNTFIFSTVSSLVGYVL